jgi:hypothetical protein
MAKLALCLILQEVGGGPIDPGFGNIGGIGGVDPGYGKPGGGHVSPPIFHPGHPDHGLPSVPGHPGNRPPGSSAGHPDNSLPWSPGHPDNSLPVPPGITPPPVPPNLKEKLVVLWHLPNTTEWHGKAIDPAAHPDQGLPPTAQPK